MAEAGTRAAAPVGAAGTGRTETLPKIVSPAFAGRMMVCGEAGQAQVARIVTWAMNPTEYEGGLGDGDEVVADYLADKVRFQGHVRFLKEGLEAAGVLPAGAARADVERAVTSALRGWNTVAGGVVLGAIDTRLRENLAAFEGM